MAWIISLVNRRAQPARLWALLLGALLLGSPCSLGSAGFGWGPRASQAQAPESYQPGREAGQDRGAGGGAGSTAQAPASGAAPGASAASAVTPRPGTPKFWRAVELLVLGAALYIQFKLLGATGLAVGWIVALILSFGLGALTFWIGFSMGGFAPRAAAVGVWMMSLLLGLCAIVLLPLTLPWWTPLALLCAMLLLPALLVGSMSKKSVA